MRELSILFIYMVGWLVVLGVSYIKRKNFICRADLVTGVVTHCEHHIERYYEPVVDLHTKEPTRFSTRKARTVYTTVVEYMYRGQKYKRTFNFPAQVGSSIKLYIDRNHPTRVELSDMCHSKTGALFKGFVFLIIFLFMMIGLNAFMSMIDPFW